MSEFILDVRGLAGWANLSDNEYGIVVAAVQAGRIIICSRVWQEFREMYPDEAGRLSTDATPRQRITQADRIAAAALADHVAATFGPYDEGVDWLVAAKAANEELTVVTDGPIQAAFYGRLDGCNALSISELIDIL